MKKYQTELNKISVVEIEKETNKSVWIDGSRRSKISDYRCYFDNYYAAFNHIHDILKREVDLCKMRTHRANTELGQFVSKYKEENK